MAKWIIKPGNREALGEKLVEIVNRANPPKDGDDITKDIGGFLAGGGANIKVYMDEHAGMTKVVLPSKQDLKDTLDAITDPKKRKEYLESLGAAIMRRCG